MWISFKQVNCKVNKGHASNRQAKLFKTFFAFLSAIYFWYATLDAIH